MYAISNASRVYITSFFLLCAAFLFAPSVANANEYWSTYEKRMISQSEVSNRVNRMLSQATSMPSNATLSTVPSAPTVTKNSAGGLSASTNQILKTLDQPSNFSATSNYSVGAAKNALKSCVRSPACAGRALGAGAIIYEGIQAWKDVYDMIYDPNTGQFIQPDHDNPVIVPPPSYDNPFVTAPAQFAQWPTSVMPSCPEYLGQGRKTIGCRFENGNTYATGCFETYQGYNFVGLQGNLCQFAADNPWTEEIPYIPVPLSELDERIDQSYVPDVSDAPIVLLSGEPETISLTTPEPADLPATTTTNTDSQGKTTTTVKNSVITYNILNNNSSSPSIESTITETSNTYDDTANLVGSMTSTTTNNAVAPDPLPPSSGASADIEIPPFCTWASIVCDWIGWTKEGIEGEEPDLINLISEFEPDEQQYNSGIGSGSCPAPMSLNLGIINRTVEVSYQPFCDFLDMIRPLVIAGAWLLSAFMYVGVLRRG